jgi:prepilin-type N-terminal cleavage/methylation domain-containing protein
MRPAVRAAGRSLARETGGFTLVEVLVAAALGLIVLGAAVTMFTSAIQSQPRAATRGASIQQARTTMERMTQELRQGSTVSFAGASQATMVTWVNSDVCGGTYSATAIQCQVTYSCTGSTCMRTERNSDGTGTPSSEQVVTGLASPNIFSVSPSCSTTAGGEDAITASDGVTLRNSSLASPTHVCVTLAFPAPT